MDIQTNVELAPYTTMYVGGPAEYFATPKTLDEVFEAIKFAKEKGLEIFVLGGGSNMVIADTGIKGLVISPANTGFEVLSETEDEVKLKVAAGQNWDKFVEECVSRGFWGIENTSHIPGNTGAVAVQNVGAYDQEASEVVESLEAVSIESLEVKTFLNSECEFKYRSSIFNSTYKGKFIITSIVFKLSKIPNPNLSYGDVKKYFEKNTFPAEPREQIQALRKAVTEIRDSKFPFPDKPEHGTCGSFFKAEPVSLDKFDNLVSKVGSIFGEEASDKIIGMKENLIVPQGVKVPYGMLLDLLGLKGKSFGKVGVCKTHAAVLQNISGEATAKDVLEAFRSVRRELYKKTGIILLNEPEFVGFSEDELKYYYELD